MREGEFTDRKSGKLVRTPQGYLAFVPDPLPPVIELTWDLVARVSAAEKALSELAGVARTLPNPQLLVGPFVRREAVLSSRIEGTQASLSDLFFFEATGSRTNESGDVQEVVNYVKALNYGLERSKEFPLSLRLIREMHQILMEGAQSGIFTPGEFRRSQNWIGPPGCTLMDASFVPPPVEEMDQALDKFEKYLHADSELPFLIRLALIHYQFEVIHPFLDGNGRVGRLLLPLLICNAGILTHPYLYLSAYFERNRQDYYRLLLSVSREGVWIEWIEFFLKGVELQSSDAIVRAEKLLALWQSYRQKMQSARSSASLLTLIDELIKNPAITYGQAARVLDVTHRAAVMNIRKLIDAGILEKVGERQRNQLFIAREIIAALESGTA